MEIPMRPRKVRQILISIGVGALIGFLLMAILIARSPKSHADPLSNYEILWVAKYGQYYCDLFAAQSTYDELKVIANHILTGGFTPDQAGDVMWVSVNAYCPNQITKMRELAQLHAGNQPQTGIYNGTVV